MTNYNKPKKMFQADVLCHRHKQHIVMFAFSKHGKGFTTYSYGTPGLGENFVASKEHEPGKVAEALFDRFMRSTYVN